ncbi:RNA polymerase I-specific transcription initiation factor RRN3 [Saccharata proteae CBS 121410]|uniref:RNA polymerase I-specific transcription initiation factor RRN3 n=1 Tax=Saccharata proteae CBS 121410 TaxID=1314787 RepID=A0A9P4M173_9PEZI|nr:RNA polymerase I-specific transcription initiation factor RRN3 [Saccharata proteae CBS 121410]
MVSLAAPPAAPSSRPTHASLVKPSLKRKHSDASSRSASPTNNFKRPKVAFNSAVQIRILEDYDDKALDLVRSELRVAIEKHLDGDSAAYDQIKQLFTAAPSAEDAPSTKLLSKFLTALMQSVSLLGGKCSGLVHAILDTQWLVRDQAFGERYIRLLEHLVSAHGGHIGQVLQMLVNYFIELPSPHTRHRADPPVKRKDFLPRIHEALRRLLRLLPTASGVLSTVLASSFPFTTESPAIHVSFVKNALAIVEYAPALRGNVLSLITERLVKIDVHIQIDMEDLEEEMEEHLIQGAMQKELDDETDSDDESVTSDSESVFNEKDDQKRIKALSEGVAKMDAILDLLFSYYEPIFAKSDSVEAEITYEMLLSHFKKIMLPAYCSRHTQFLIFHFGQRSPVFVDAFASTCIGLALEPTQAAATRVAASAYLASFFARGAQVPAETVRNVFTIVASQLDAFREKHDPMCKGPDLVRYGPYYALAQALFYIFCFRWRDLLSETDDDQEIDDLIHEGKDLPWVHGIKEFTMRNIYSRLNPLRVCAPAIVTQFARIAHHLRFVYVFPLLETNKRVILPRPVGSNMSNGMQIRETALSHKDIGLGLRLDAYFPFDPYQLPKSKKWIENDYNEWKSIPGLDEGRADDASDSDSQADDSEDEDLDEETATEVST